MNEYGQHYVAIVIDEPIAGVPSHRVYGPFDTAQEALAAFPVGSLPEGTYSGYLLLRGPEEVVKENLKPTL